MKEKKANPTTTPTTDSSSSLDAILDVLKTEKSFLISGHQNPDGDVIGSGLALKSLIERLNPKAEVEIQTSGAVPKSLFFLPGVDLVKNTTKIHRSYDVVVVLECSGAERMGNIIDFKTQAKKVINIDHHLHNPHYGHINIVEPATSSTSELIFKLYERARQPLSAAEATCLYTGLVTDTGWFRYGNTNKQSHEIAGQLLAAGVNVAAFAEHMFFSRSMASVRLLGWALSHMKLHFDNRVAVFSLSDDILKSIGATSEDTEDIVNFGLHIESVLVSVLLKEKSGPSIVKASLRSKGQTDINQVARKLGGGGHRNASGCSINANLSQAEEILLNEILSIF